MPVVPLTLYSITVPWQPVLPCNILHNHDITIQIRAKSGKLYKHGLVTERSISNEALALYRALGITVVRA